MEAAEAAAAAGGVGLSTSLTLALESDMLSTLEPESAHSAFNLNPRCLSLHPYSGVFYTEAAAVAEGGAAAPSDSAAAASTPGEARQQREASNIGSSLVVRNFTTKH